MLENAFKNAVYSAKSMDGLRDNLLNLWGQIKVDDTIDLKWLGGRPKYRKAVSDILLDEYQKGNIYAIWSQDEQRI
ncbi:MAG: hypothetical protein EOM16_09795, partial [Bacteroidia bacterium]|nr:hypothetical protein [Bacteroidia bacterium]